MPSLITILSSVLLATHCCHALPNPTMNTGMGMPPPPPSTTGMDNSSAAAAAAAAASASGSQNNNNNCSPPPSPPPCPPPFIPSPCPPPFNPSPPCPPPFNPSPPCPPPPPFNPSPPCPPPFNPPSCTPPPPCTPSPYGPPPHAGGSSSSSAAAAAAASASGSGSGASASASAAASASTTVQVPNLQQLCSYPTDVQQCSSIYSLRYQHTEFQQLHGRTFYIYYASRTQQQITFDSAPCFDFSCSQSCQTIMIKFSVESTTSITKTIWGSDTTGQLSYVKTSVKVISQEYAVLQDTFVEAQKVVSGSTTAVVATQTEQLQQFVSSSPYVLMYSDYQHVLAMRRCSDQTSFIAVCDSLYQNQQTLQTNAMSAIQSIMSFHQIDVSMCSTLTQAFSLDINSIAITSASFDMTKTPDGTMISGNKIQRQDGNSVMSGETSVSRTSNGDVSMSSSTSTNVSGGYNAGMPSGLPCPSPTSTAGSAAAASAAASAAAGSS